MLNLTQDDIAVLTPQERIALIDRLWDSLSDRDLPLPSAQAAELDRRLASFDAELPKAVSWDVLKTELAARAP